MTISSQLRQVLDAMDAAGIAGVETLSAPDARAQMDAMSRARAVGAIPEVGSVSEIDIPAGHGSLPARVYRPTAEPQMLALYIHGGGWVLGSLDHADIAVRIMCQRLSAVIVSLDYRLAPEHPFPAGYEDSLTALDWIVAGRESLAAGIPLVVIGDSAGANIATAVALEDGESERPSLDAQLLLYPVTDATRSQPSYTENATGYILTAAAMEWFWDQYVPEDQRGDRRVSPLHAPELSKSPPAIVATAGYDPLRDEGIAYALRLRDAGVQVEERHFPGLVHGFISMATSLPEAGAALDESCAALIGMLSGVTPRLTRSTELR